MKKILKYFLNNLKYQQKILYYNCKQTKIIMNTAESLNKAFQILGELMNEDCFDFLEVQNLNFEDRKDYLRQMIFEFFRGGEVNLGGIIKRIDSDNFNDNERASEETIENINNFFKNELLVADIILLMDEDIYESFCNEINN